MTPELKASLASLALLAIKQLGPPLVNLVETFVLKLQDRLANPPTDIPTLEDTLVQKAINEARRVQS